MNYSFEEFLEDLNMGREIHFIYRDENTISVVELVSLCFGGSMIFQVKL